MIEYLDWNDRRVCYCFTLDVSSESLFVVLCRRASFRSFKLPPDSLVMKNILWAHSIGCDYCLAPKNKRLRQKISATPKQRERKRKKLHNFIIFVVRLHNDAHTSLDQWWSIELAGQQKAEMDALSMVLWSVIQYTILLWVDLLENIYYVNIFSFLLAHCPPQTVWDAALFLFWNTRYSDQLQ